MVKVSNKVSTTQMAGTIAISLTIYNTLAPAMKWPVIDLGTEQVNAIATVATVALPTIYMMYRRTKKSVLKWGLFK